MLRDQGVSILAGAQVTEMRMAGGGGSGEAAAGGGEDLAKRLVLLRDSQGQQEVRASGDGSKQSLWAVDCGEGADYVVLSW